MGLELYYYVEMCFLFISGASNNTEVNERQLVLHGREEMEEDKKHPHTNIQCRKTQTGNYGKTNFLCFCVSVFGFKKETFHRPQCALDLYN